MVAATEPLTFGLVHGGAHGAWCWDRVVAQLSRRGHRGIAMDLPCEDETAGALTYAEVVVRALAGVSQPVILVGHSLGGVTVPLVAGLRPTQLMIFLGALLPEPGRSLQQQRQAEPEMMFPYRGGRAGLRERFFHTCDPRDADQAMSRLRHQSMRPFEEVTPLRSWPAVRSAYIVCGKDRACNPEWARRAVPTRLGVTPVELPDCDHSPYLCRPAELTELLIRLARGQGRSSPAG